MIGDDLHLFDGVERRLEAFARGAVVVVVKAVDGDVVRVGRAARERERARLLGGLGRAARVAGLVAVFGRVARRERLLRDAAEQVDEVERRVGEGGQTLQLLARDGAARDRARRVDEGRVSFAHDRLLRRERGRPEREIEPHGLAGEREDFPPLFRGEARALGAERVRAGRKLEQTVAPLAVGRGRALRARVDEARRDGSAGDDRASLVRDDAREGHVVQVLRGRGRRKTEDEKGADEDVGGVAVHAFFSRRRPERRGGEAGARG